MRGPRLAAGTAALMAAACLAGMATVASAAPSKASLATASSRSGIREVPPGKKYSTAKLGAVRQQSARARALAAPAAPTPAVGTVRQWLALDDFNGHPVPQGLHAARRRRQHRGLGRQRHSPSRPATAGRRSPNSTHDHRRPGRAPDHRVRHQHVPEGDGGLQHAAGPGRHQRPPRAGRQRQRRRLHRRRRQDRHAGRQRPGRQLLHVPGGADLHRRLLLLAVQRAVRPQRHDDRRVRLGCTAPRRTRRTSRPPTCAPAARRARTSTRAPSPTSGSTCCTTTPTRSRRPGSTRACPTSPRPLTGYVDATATVFDRGADSHIYCFQGFGTVQTPFNPNPRDCGGPENSLNLWGEGAIRTRSWPTTATRTRSCCSCTTGTARTSSRALHRDGDLQGLAEPRGGAEGRGRRAACTRSSTTSSR